MDNRVRILQVIPGMGSGGAEMFLMNMYRNMDHDKIVFDFLLQSNENIYKDELDNYGSRIYRIPPYYKHCFENHAQLKNILNMGYPVVHLHANALLYITPLLYAKKAGIPCRIIHSHSTSMYYKWAIPYHRWNKRRVERCATHCFACSDEAGAWMFNRGYTVIHDAIDLECFSFRPEQRTKYRRELGVHDGELLIGQIGRLYATKNPLFSLEVLHEMLSQGKDCSLFFVGEGNRADLHSKAKSMGIEGNVRFLGLRTDVSSLINAFDVLVVPSLYEGLSIVTIEAQANGLAAVCSDAVPEECILADNISRLPLSLGAKAWADAVLAADCKRTDNMQKLIDAGYNIRTEAKKLQDFYLNCIRENG